MLRGFKDFIMRGNAVELAVGIVIGAAFNNLVGAFTTAFLEPLIKLVSGGDKLGGKVTIGGVEFPWSTFFNAVISFLLAAAVVYFLVVLPMNKLAERRARGQEPRQKAPSEEVRLLTEIRDAVRGEPVPAGAAGRAGEGAAPARTTSGRAARSSERLGVELPEPEPDSRDR
jgi:large conductance mechanosensitive channel